MWMWWLVACVSLPEQQAEYLRGAYFNWNGFNHRVSAVQFAANEGQAEMVVIGGTSTTLTPADLDDGCDPGICLEFPFIDNSVARLGWGRLTSDTVALGTGSVEFDVPRAGASSTLDIELDGVPGGEVTAILTGFGLNTDRPLAGEAACYRPEYGWHPRRIALSIDDVTVSGKTATVAVRAAFEAGATFEAERVCIDEVFERAVAAMRLDVLVLAGVDVVTAQTITAAADYPFGDQVNPKPQEEAEPTPLSNVAPVNGWQSVDFAFDAGDGRGAYLRSFGFEITEAGAAGIATNFSPGTQLSGMSYTFEGTVLAIEADGAVQTGTVAVEELPAELDGDDNPEVQTFPL
ncbi:MAG: hypothetical protein AAGA48_11890 [Myxococcota bacterium]